LNSTILRSELNTKLIDKLLNIKPPYTPEQIIQIEALKKPHQTDYNKKTNECSFCLRPQNSNPLSQYDKFLKCNDCGSQAHSYCLKYSASLIEHIRTHKLKWQCFECKQCSVCLNSSDNMLLCDLCDRAYHKECCKPVIYKRPKGQFICNLCKDVYFKEDKLLMSSKKSGKSGKQKNEVPLSGKKRKLSTNSNNSSTNSVVSLGQINSENSNSPVLKKNPLSKSGLLASF
jgi:hypothetical protein